MATPLMGLNLPVVGPAGTLGPDWANELNAAFDKIDSHDHTSGKGNPIPFSAIEVTSNLNLLNYGLINSDFVQFQNNNSDITTQYPSIYVYNDELWYRETPLIATQITSNGALNLGGSGNIGGMSGGASVTYSNISETYTFRVDANTLAGIVGGPLTMYDNSNPAADGNYIQLKSPSGLGSSYNVTMPAALPATKRSLSLNSSGILVADNFEIGHYDAVNYTVTATVNASALTIALKTQSGGDPSVSDPVKIGFRNSTATSGSFNIREATAATSLVISSGSTLGHSNATAHYIYVYAVDNDGTIELAVSSTMINDRVVQSTTAEGAAGGADSGSTLYSTTARTNKPIRLIARLTSNQSIAGTWNAVPTAITLDPDNKEPVNYAVSSNSGTFTTTATTVGGVDVTNLNVSITTSGRPVMVTLMAADGGVAAYIGAFATTGTRTNSNIYFYRNGVQINYCLVALETAGAGAYYETAVPPSSFALVDVNAPAGKHTYSVKARAGTGDTCTVVECKLVAYEL